MPTPQRPASSITAKPSAKKKKVAPPYSVRLATDLQWQFTPAAEILGITPAEFTRLALRNLINSWFGQASSMAEKYAQRIVKKALKGVNFDHPAKLEKRIEQLQKSDFYLEIKRLIKFDRLDQIETWPEDIIWYGVRDYFQQLQARELADPQVLIRQRAKISQWFAKEIRRNIQVTLHDYLILGDLRSQAKKLSAATPLGAEEMNDPVLLKKLINRALYPPQLIHKK